jgi:cytochrome oxidase Cu insertion factor (SCO1/SenC/PrrC family)
MLAALVIVFGDSLRRDLRLLGARRAWRVGALAAGMLPLGGMLLVAARAAGVPAAAERHQEAQDWWLSRVDREAPFVVMLDQHGQRFSLADVRRQPVVVTFAFAHCTTVCPAIVSDLRAARRGTGRADIPLLVITLDPWRDTPERLPALAATWGLGPGDRALSGSVADVERVLDDLGVGRRRIEQNGDIEHIGTAMIVDANGRIAWRLDGSPRGVAALLAKL